MPLCRGCAQKRSALLCTNQYTHLIVCNFSQSLNRSLRQEKYKTEPPREAAGTHEDSAEQAFGPCSPLSSPRGPSTETGALAVFGHALGGRRDPQPPL